MHEIFLFRILGNRSIDVCEHATYRVKAHAGSNHAIGCARNNAITVSRNSEYRHRDVRSV